MSNIFGNVVGGPGVPKTFIIEGEDGTEIIGTVVGNETLLTATPDDIRKGKIAATDDGIVEGTKDIPAYSTRSAYRLVANNKSLSIPLNENDRYDYTKFQCIVAVYSSDYSNTAITKYVSINDVLFSVETNEKVSDITKNHNTKTIDLNITNNSGSNYLIFYFTYKEI